MISGHTSRLPWCGGSEYRRRNHCHSVCIALRSCVLLPTLILPGSFNIQRESGMPDSGISYMKRRCTVRANQKGTYWSGGEAILAFRLMHFLTKLSCYYGAEEIKKPGLSASFLAQCGVDTDIRPVTGRSRFCFGISLGRYSLRFPRDLCSDRAVFGETILGAPINPGSLRGARRFSWRRRSFTRSNWACCVPAMPTNGTRGLYILFLLLLLVPEDLAVAFHPRCR